MCLTFLPWGKFKTVNNDDGDGDVDDVLFFVQLDSLALAHHCGDQTLRQNH